MAKSWQEKFEARQAPEVAVLEKRFGGMEPGRRMLISTPAEVEEFVMAIPTGETVSVAEMRDALARKHGCDGTCPLTASIFLRIVAERALEQGRSVPFWRIIDPKSPLAAKLSCGLDYIARMRAGETT